MARRRRDARWSAVGLACGLALLAMPAWADVAVSLTPVRVELASVRAAGSVQVRSRASTPRLFQASVVRWDARMGRAQAEAVDWLRADPVIFELPAGGAQMVRLGCLAGCERARPGSYRLLLRELELPGAAPPAAGRVPMRLSFSLPVLVGAAPAPSQRAWSRAGRALRVHNGGERAARLRTVEVVDARGTAQTLRPPGLGDVLEGQELQWTLARTVQPPLRVRATWDDTVQAVPVP